MSDYLKPWPRHCNNCEGEEGDHVAKLGRCKGCRTHYYCDTECQLESWEDHKLLCRLGRIVEKREGRGPRRWIKVCLSCFGRHVGQLSSNGVFCVGPSSSHYPCHKPDASVLR